MIILESIYVALQFSRNSISEGVLYTLLNPIISHQEKNSSLRKVKTYEIDANQLCVLLYKGEPHKNRGIQLLDLRNLSTGNHIEYAVVSLIEERLSILWISVF